jgi:selenocysteine-specific elongation factor
MIVGTAGHIDHGKTTLVRALTGIDTDRLPEEKRRGISIELGYAFLDVPGAAARIAFVDAPGHERLVHTMLAGASGIDYALLLVAADDGVMPQTREHLAVLSLLGIGAGAIVVTKVDRADPHRALAEARALVAGTVLEAAPALAVSAVRGDGLGDLKTLLFEAARRNRRRAVEREAFRLAVDRAFVLDGVGTVATGTIHAGDVAVGDELRLVPGEHRVRVRSVHAQNRPIERASAGQRCALALAGVAKDAIARGQWLVAPEVALETRRLDASLTLWHAEPRALRSGTRVQVHVGAAAAIGSVAVLDGEAIAPGGTARVQLVLDAPVGAWNGDRLVLRDAAASRTLAGGVVLDPFAPARYRRTAQRLAELDAFAQGDLRALLEAAPLGVDLERFDAALGRRAGEDHGVDPGGIAARGWALSPAHAAAVAGAALGALAAFHARGPDDPGPDVARLRRLAAPRLAEPLWLALVTRLHDEGRLERHGARVHLPEHGVRLSAAEARIAEKVVPALVAAGFEGAWVRDLARDARVPELLMRGTLARLAQRGDLHQVVKDLYLGPEAVARLARTVRTVAGDRHEVSAATFRDATGLGRKRAIQVLEYFDRVGLLRRVGDVHRLRADTRLFAEAEAA